MNSLLLIIIGLPILEIAVMINIGQEIGVLNTILIIFITAIVGIYYARIEGLNTIRSGMVNLYKNKIPIYEMISGASIALAAILLILPGFVTDTVGFLLIFPLTRKIIITLWLNKRNNLKKPKDFIEAEIIEEKKDKDEL
tara:strand:- start:998 stop:1417 length:420 start_codon:yes stop_codon:yes gene_type:complete